MTEGQYLTDMEASQSEKFAEHYHGPDTILGTRNTTGIMRVKVLAFMELMF